MAKMTEKDFKKNLKLAREIYKTFGKTKSADALINKLNKKRTTFLKQNPSYVEYIQLSGKYNRLRTRVNKLSDNYQLIANNFSNTPNPFAKKKGLSPIKFEGKKTIKTLTTNIESLQSLWTENHLKVYGKHNNIKLLMMTALLNEKTYEEFLPSESWQEIRKDEAEHGDTGFRSEKRITELLNVLNRRALENPEFFGEVSPAQIKKYVKDYLVKYDKNFPEDKLLELFEKLSKEGAI